ncbi:hypothetical protein [Francisella philomiragia]|uniref:hypothetical protein n=1 Tax=Francisella philomiragia TaxID=28110 RepID=UPI0019057182|nr:hypothetical protein [Francisella philomiragia]MBK2279824.1 hypothetical protein [Francisella philomiragia]MBK2289673.1 hypothetical protein [Francisella philomiragia]MBK2291612.1 hypothetical protein [Francisella philomiragia]
MNLKKIICTVLPLAFASSAFAISSLSVSISADGKYTVADDRDDNVYLYNLNNKNISKINNEKVNHFSPNFIDGTDNFIYQDIDNKVYVVNADTKKVIKSFEVPQIKPKGFEHQQNIYFQTLNKDMDIYVYVTQLGINIAKVADGKLENIYSYNKEFMGTRFVPKIYDNKVIATSRDTLLIFDLNKVFKDDKYTPIKISKNSGETMNAISPDGKYIYTADKQFGGIKYDLSANKVIQKLFYYPTKVDNVSYHKIGYDSGEFFNKLANFKFIDKDTIIATFVGVNQPYLWAALYKPNEYKKESNHDTTYSIKYLPLTKDPLKFVTGNYRDNTDPYPVADRYNTVFDTSVKSHTLVIGRANDRGIMVYNYNPSDESLKLDWVAEPPKPESKGWFW